MRRRCSIRSQRQIEEHKRISGEKIAESVKCAVIQKGTPAAPRTYLLVNSDRRKSGRVPRRRSRRESE
eukprot:6491282-Amphidinium_carterae.2